MSTSANTSRSSDTSPSEDMLHTNQNGSHAVHSDVQRVSTTSSLAKLYRGATSSMRLLPDFLIIGTQRGGTTSLYHYLEAHPCIEPATTKEIHFFDRRVDKGLAWYRGHFPTSIEKYYAEHLRGRAFVTGEASPSYLFHPHAPKRAAKALPHTKLIILLRNPIDRAYSQYYHSLELGYETLPFEEAIEGEEERTAREREKILQDEAYESYAYKHLSYLTRGIYVDQLRVWMDLFPREQFLILKSEEFYADPGASLKQVLAFLKLPEMETEVLPEPRGGKSEGLPRSGSSVAGSHSQVRKKEYKQYNNTTYSKMDSALRKRLVEYFEPHNARLYDFLGVDFGWDK